MAMFDCDLSRGGQLMKLLLMAMTLMVMLTQTSRAAPSTDLTTRRPEVVYYLPEPCRGNLTYSVHEYLAVRTRSPDDRADWDCLLHLRLEDETDNAQLVFEQLHLGQDSDSKNCSNSVQLFSDADLQTSLTGPLCSETDTPERVVSEGGRVSLKLKTSHSERHRQGVSVSLQFRRVEDGHPTGSGSEGLLNRFTCPRRLLETLTLLWAIHTILTS